MSEIRKFAFGAAALALTGITACEGRSPGEHARAEATRAYTDLRVEAVEECVARGAFGNVNMMTIVQYPDERLIAAGCADNPAELLRLRGEAGL